MTEFKLNTSLLKAWLDHRNGRRDKGPIIGEWDEDHWLCSLNGCAAHIIAKSQLHLDLSAWGEQAQFHCDSFHPGKSVQYPLEFTGQCLVAPDKTGKPRIIRVYRFPDTSDAPGRRVYLDARYVAEFDDAGIVRMTGSSDLAPVYFYTTADDWAEPCGFALPINPKTVEKPTKEGPSHA